MSEIVARLRRAAFVRFKDGFQSKDLAEAAAREIECLLRDRDYWRKRSETPPPMTNPVTPDANHRARGIPVDGEPEGRKE